MEISTVPKLADWFARFSSARHIRTMNGIWKAPADTREVPVFFSRRRVRLLLILMAAGAMAGVGWGILSGIAGGKRYVSRGEARVAVEGSQSPGDGDRRKKVMEAAGKVAERMAFPDALLGDRMAPDYGKSARYDCVLQREFRAASGTFELAVTSGDPEVSFEYATAILNWFKEDVTGNQELWPLSVRFVRQPELSREAEPVWQWPQIASRAAVLAGSSAVVAFLILLGRWRAKQPRCTALPEPAEY